MLTLTFSPKVCASEWRRGSPSPLQGEGGESSAICANFHSPPVPSDREGRINRELSNNFLNHLNQLLDEGFVLSEVQPGLRMVFLPATLHVRPGWDTWKHRLESPKKVFDRDHI